MTDLANKRCTPCRGDTPAVVPDKVTAYLQTLPGWAAGDDQKEIAKVFEFKNYYETMAFVNAVAWIAHREDHHPDLGVSYRNCRVRYSTHAIRGLSENDFICAAKVEALLSG